MAKDRWSLSPGFFPTDRPYRVSGKVARSVSIWNTRGTINHDQNSSVPHNRHTNHQALCCRSRTRAYPCFSSASLRDVAKEKIEKKLRNRETRWAVGIDRRSQLFARLKVSFKDSAFFPPSPFSLSLSLSLLFSFSFFFSSLFLLPASFHRFLSSTLLFANWAATFGRAYDAERYSFFLFFFFLFFLSFFPSWRVISVHKSMWTLFAEHLHFSCDCAPLAKSRIIINKTRLLDCRYCDCNWVFLACSTRAPPRHWWVACLYLFFFPSLSLYLYALYFIFIIPLPPASLIHHRWQDFLHTMVVWPAELTPKDSLVALEKDEEKLSQIFAISRGREGERERDSECV